LVNESHGYVYLFTLFLSGLVAMMEKSGGMYGFTRSIAKYASTARAGQFATFFVGIVVFFDDYANTLLAGGAMRPLTDMLFISREKLAFIVDATAAPIASLTPISSWVGFEVGLIQNELNRIVALVGEDNVTIETSGMAVFLQSIKYRYYPIFMLILIPLLIFANRDFGPMLIAERKARVYQRSDGGDGKGPSSQHENSESESSNEPRPDTPQYVWNMVIPILLLVFFIFYLLVQSGDDGTGEQSVMDKIEASDSYTALLYGTMATTMLSGILYGVQLVHHGNLVMPTLPVLKALFSRGKEEAETDDNDKNNQGSGDKDTPTVSDDAVISFGKPRPLMSVGECIESFLYGMHRIFPALIVLTLAWASGAIMVAVGADRLFSRWIVGGIDPTSLPTLSFCISLLMALATGTSWGTMTIMFPLLCVPTYQSSGGDPIIFYSTVAGILSGSVAGDHMSPISDTTVLSSLASDCNLMRHVLTQIPYVLFAVLLSILLGTIPIGRSAWPNFVGILLGIVVIALFVYGLCVPILSPTGRFDIFTILYLKTKGTNHPLRRLQDDTAAQSQQQQVASVDSDQMQEEGDGNDKLLEKKEDEGKDTTEMATKKEEVVPGTEPTEPNAPVESSGQEGSVEIGV